MTAQIMNLIWWIRMASGVWRPQHVRRFIRGLPTSAKTAIVETDVGTGYLKAMGGGEGPQTLVSEVVCARLAEWMGLETLDWAIISVDEVDEIPFVNEVGTQVGKGIAGPAFITRAEKGTPWSGGTKDLNRIANSVDIAKLVLLDTWTLNCDRYGPRPEGEAGNPRVNRDNVFFSEENAPDGQFLLKAIDHTHCFTCGRSWNTSISDLNRIRDGRIFGMFPEFRSLLDRAALVSAATHLANFSRSVAIEATKDIPREWELSTAVQEALQALLYSRATFVAETIEGKLWPQATLGFSE